MTLGHDGTVRRVLTTGLAAAALCAASGSPARAQSAADFLAPSAWQLGLAAQREWDSNVRFVEPDGAGDFVNRLRLEGGRAWLGRRGRLTMSAGGALVRYGQLAELDRTAYDARLDATRQLTRRTAGRLTYSLRSDLTRDALISAGGTAAPLAALSMARTHDVGASVERHLSRRRWAGLTTRVQSATYESPLFQDGWSASGRVGTGGRLSRSATLDVGYEYQHSTTAGRLVDGHVVAGTWTRRLAEGVEARLNAGVSKLVPLQAGDSAGIPPQLAGGGELSARRTRVGASARYQRGAGQMFGTGDVVRTDLMSLRGDAMLHRALRLDLAADRAWATSIVGTQGAVRSTGATAGLHWVSRAGPVVGANAFVRSRAQGALVSARGVSVTVGYALAGRRSGATGAARTP